MVQWIRICLSTQGTRFRSLVWEDSHAMEQLKPLQPATEPMCCDGQSLGTWSHRSEKPARRRREQTLLTKTRGGPRAAMTIQRNQKKKKKLQRLNHGFNWILPYTKASYFVAFT